MRRTLLATKELGMFSSELFATFTDYAGHKISACVQECVCRPFGFEVDVLETDATRALVRYWNIRDSETAIVRLSDLREE